MSSRYQSSHTSFFSWESTVWGLCWGTLGLASAKYSLSIALIKHPAQCIAGIVFPIIISNAFSQYITERKKMAIIDRKRYVDSLRMQELGSGERDLALIPEYNKKFSTVIEDLQKSGIVFEGRKVIELSPKH